MLVRDVLPKINGGQFGELLPRFTSEERPLYYHMTISQALRYRLDILEEDSSLLMRIFLGEVANTFCAERPTKRLKLCEDDDVVHSSDGGSDQDATAGSPMKVVPGKQQIPALVFGEPPALTSKQYGVRPEQVGKGLKNQFLKFFDHVTRPINLERDGPKMSPSTANDQKGSFFRYVFYN